jgi:hypothetical protein
MVGFEAGMEEEEEEERGGLAALLALVSLRARSLALSATWKARVTLWRTWRRGERGEEGGGGLERVGERLEGEDGLEGGHRR